MTRIDAASVAKLLLLRNPLVLAAIGLVLVLLIVGALLVSPLLLAVPVLAFLLWKRK